jgi:hypothetical protein
MKIDTTAPYLRPYDPKDAAPRPPPQEKAPAVARVLGGPIGSALYRVELKDGQPAAAGAGNERLVELLRTVSKEVAAYIGPKAKIATAAVWLSIDAKGLRDHWHDADMAGTRRLADAATLTADALDAMGTVKGLGLAGGAATTIYALVDLGDCVQEGKVTLDASDLASFAGVDDTGVGLLKLPGLLQ